MFLVLLLFNIFTETISLSDAISTVLKHNGEVLGAKEKINYANALLSEAKAGYLPKGNLDLFAAPIFKTTGNALNSQSDWSTWGALVGVRATILQPIYTFGMLSSYKKAAQYGQGVYSAEFDKKKQDIIYKTKQFYYGVMLANDLVSLLEEAKKKLKDAIDEADGENGKVARGKMKLEDFYALKTFYSMLLPKYDEAKRTQVLSKKALSWVMMKQNEDFSLEDDTINPEEVELKPLKYYTDLMLKHRPDLRRLNLGVLAKKELYNASKSKMYPMFFALGMFNYTHTGVREDQTSPFANDPYNDLSGAFLLGLRFNVDWGSLKAKAEQLRAQYQELASSQETLLRGMKLELGKAYLECLDAQKAIDYGEDAEKNAKKWLMNVFVGYGLGTVETDKFTDALKSYFAASLEFNMTIYKFNMALAQLTKLVGVEVVPRLKY